MWRILLKHVFLLGKKTNANIIQLPTKNLILLLKLLNYSKKRLLSRGQEVQVQIPNNKKISAELLPGQMSIHHGLMIHGSGPNILNDRRIGVAIRYINPDVVQNTKKSYAMPVRGIDKKGNFTHYFAPKTLFSEFNLKLSLIHI